MKVKQVIAGRIEELEDDFYGLRVEKQDDAFAPYLLHGKRGACYALIRPHDCSNPHLLYPVNAKGNCQTVMIRGNGWFTDEGGILSPLWCA